MLQEWQQQWAGCQLSYSERVALRTEAGELSFGDLGRLAEQWSEHYKAQPQWQVGSCVALPWRHPYSDLPRLLGLWLAGGVWIAHEHGSVHSALAQELAAGLQGPATGASCWQTILFSSGSTGPAKLFVRGWRQALLEARANANRLKLPAGSTSAMLVNPWFGASTKHLLAGLLQGWCQVIGRASLPLLPESSDLLYATPSQIQGLGSAQPRGPHFSWISLTGEACPASLWPVLQSWGRPGGHCLNALGASETGVIAQQVLPLNGSWQRFLGQPFEGKRVSLVDDQGQELIHAGSIGRLQIDGPALIEGQLLKGPDGWQLDATPTCAGLMSVLSNDLARWSEAGELDLLGRSNQLLKRHGEWIDASPLQRALEQQPGVQRCQLFCDPDGLSAWLAMEQPSRSALRSIAGAVANSLDDARLLPQRLIAVAEFPLNSNGKLDMAALREPDAHTNLPGAVLWEQQPRRQRLHAQLDSLDQAQLVSRLQSTNLLWCGGGLAALEEHCPADVGLVGLGFPKPPPHWDQSTACNLSTIAAEQADLLLHTTAGELGTNLWLGGFSLPAWLAYAVALELESRGCAVAGVILLDPVDPFRSTYRWRWRRNLARQWRHGPGALFQGHRREQRLALKSWRQELLGQWIEAQAPRSIKAKLLVFSSAWPAHLKRHRGERLRQKPEWITLTTTVHENVVTSADAINEWMPVLWSRITNQ